MNYAPQNDRPQSNPQIGSAQRDFDDLRAQTDHVVDRVEYLEALKVEGFVVAARDRERARRFGRTRLLLLVVALCVVPVGAWFVSASMPTGVMGWIAFGVVLVAGEFVVWCVWRENSRVNGVRGSLPWEGTRDGVAGGAGLPERHSAFTESKSPVRRW